ncbi:MAG: 16S rRNA (cytosine(967)-C(5))-methyltransferase RsmB [Pseudomonadota bacterium]|nr:16S rRNA (cytosine(967)-C(5))-methyltransferase RsmB [Pseudomonadota bacterium]
MNHSAYSLAALAVSRTLSGQTLTHVLAEQDFQSSINPAAVRDMTSNALRFLGQSKVIIQKLSRQLNQDARVEALLYIGISQIALGRPAYAIVNAIVDACEPLNRSWAKKYTNALLRSYLRQQETLNQVIVENELGRYNHPIWWINLLKQDWPQDWLSILSANQTHPPMTLRTNKRRISLDEYIIMLDKAGVMTSRYENNALILEKPQSVHNLPGFSEGLVSVQDSSAQWAAHLLDLSPGQRILDACCAPGGKSAHILELADVHLTGIDSDSNRLDMARSTLDRLGLKAFLIKADVREIDTWWDGIPFDRILADVPCSASGIVRRHPDIKWNRRLEDLDSFSHAQAEIMDALWQCLAIGGKLLYATCSVFKQENANQTALFLEMHPDARLLPLTKLSEKDKQLLPNAQQDGFYYALFERNAGLH